MPLIRITRPTSGVTLQVIFKITLQVIFKITLQVIFKVTLWVIIKVTGIGLKSLVLCGVRKGYLEFYTIKMC